MGKKKWTGANERRRNHKGKGRQGGKLKHSKHKIENRNIKSSRGYEAKESNSSENLNNRRAIKFNLMEKDIGVTEYVGTTPGFNAVIKARFSDFQVNEIDFDGKVVKLTDTSLPPVPQSIADAKCESADQAIELIGQDVWNNLIELSKAVGMTTEIEVNSESMSKEQRGIIHKIVKQSFGSSIVSSTVTKDEKKFFKFAKFKKNVRHDQRTKWLWPGEYTYFVVYKENLDTMKAAGDLSQGLNANPKAISYAGTKDRRAKTSQWFCIRKREPEKISKAADMKRSIHVGNFMFKDEPLKLGHLNGNRFRIALRHITHPECNIDQSLQSLNENGFINYYGLQRFGNNSTVPTHQVGLAIIKGQFKEACELILKPREGEQTFMKQIREHWWKHRDPEAALKFFYNKSFGVEAKLLSGFVRHGNNDFVNSLNNLPRNMLLMYIHSYQSLIWNEIASKRIKLGIRLLPGDLVFVNDDKSTITPLVEDVIDDDGFLFGDAEDDNNEDEGDNEKIEKPEEVSNFKNMVKSLTDDDINSCKYSIFDLVLPLPGHDISYPTNDSGQWYIDRLAVDGLTSEKLKSKQKRFSLCGAYRKLLVKPTNVSWYFMKYKNDTDDLIQSDLEELRGVDSPMSAEDGDFKALILEFCLPTATYATMLLREVIKQDTSASNQIKLESESIAAMASEKRKAEDVCSDEDDQDLKKVKKNEESVDILQ